MSSCTFGLKAVGHIPSRFKNQISVRRASFQVQFQLRSSQQFKASAMEAAGTDSDGREFRNAEEMWRVEIGEGESDKKHEWYRGGVGYWQGVEASVDGVLGGYGHVNEVDIKGSEAFLKTLFADRSFTASTNPHRLVALDCGSGIGRVTKNLLLRFFNEVDLVEPVSHFLDAARTSLTPEHGMVADDHKAANFYCVPLQEFTPEEGRYDVIWVQWCIGQLADDDFVSFFRRAKAGLKPNGIFVLKENIAKSGFVLDKEDRSITRSDLYFKELFNRCGLHLLKSKDTDTDFVSITNITTAPDSVLKNPYLYRDSKSIELSESCYWHIPFEKQTSSPAITNKYDQQARKRPRNSTFIPPHCLTRATSPWTDLYHQGFTRSLSL